MAVKISIVGMGSMGKGLLYQTLVTPEIDCVAISDIDIEKCVKIAKEFSLQYAVTKNAGETKKAIDSRILAICERCVDAAETSSDVFVEASSSVVDGGFYSKRALYHKHLVLMNSEVDLIFGPHLRRIADKKEHTYTSCDGDQHGVLKKIIDEISFWGLKPIMAGNIKGFLDRYANPTTIIPEADKRNLSYKMCTAYTDGTKLNIEMALVANATAMLPKQIGMTGPKLKHVNEVLEKFELSPSTKSVDYILGAEPGGGVFVVGYNSDPYQQSMLEYYKMGKGPYYLFYRPYHLCHIESMQCIIEATKRKSLLKPSGMKTNVFSFAKKDLVKGERLDGIGGYTCYGMIDVQNAYENRLPICLSENMVLKRDKPKDSVILETDVEFPASWEHVRRNIDENTYDPWMMYKMNIT